MIYFACRSSPYGNRKEKSACELCVVPLVRGFLRVFPLQSIHASSHRFFFPPFCFLYFVLVTQELERGEKVKDESFNHYRFFLKSSQLTYFQCVF